MHVLIRQLRPAFLAVVVFTVLLRARLPAARHRRRPGRVRRHGRRLARRASTASSSARRSSVRPSRRRSTSTPARRPPVTATTARRRAARTSARRTPTTWRPSPSASPPTAPRTASAPTPSCRSTRSPRRAPASTPTSRCATPALQAPRVAAERGLALAAVQAAIDDHTTAARSASSATPASTCSSSTWRSTRPPGDERLTPVPWPRSLTSCPARQRGGAASCACTSAPRRVSARRSRCSTRAIDARSADSDVVVGIVETHGRQRTTEQLADLEIVPRQVVSHRGSALSEMDTAAILRRRPQLVLVDELAHTNAPGSQHEKRWQDVRGAPGRRHRCHLDRQHPAPRVAQRRRRADHWDPPAGDDPGSRRAGRRSHRAGRHGARGPAASPRPWQRLRRRPDRRRPRQLLPSRQPRRRCASWRCCGSPTASTTRCRTTANATASRGRGRRASGSSSPSPARRTPITSSAARLADGAAGQGRPHRSARGRRLRPHRVERGGVGGDDGGAAPAPRGARRRVPPDHQQRRRRRPRRPGALGERHPDRPRRQCAAVVGRSCWADR